MLGTIAFQEMEMMTVWGPSLVAAPVLIAARWVCTGEGNTSSILHHTHHQYTSSPSRTNYVGNNFSFQFLGFRQNQFIMWCTCSKVSDNKNNSFQCCVGYGKCVSRWMKNVWKEFTSREPENIKKIPQFLEIYRKIGADIQKNSCNIFVSRHKHYQLCCCKPDWMFMLSVHGALDLVRIGDQQLPWVTCSLCQF